jgi:hypothetical protein
VAADVETAVIPEKDVMRQAISEVVTDIDQGRDQRSGFNKQELDAIVTELQAE